MHGGDRRQQEMQERNGNCKEKVAKGKGKAVMVADSHRISNFTSCHELHDLSEPVDLTDFSGETPLDVPVM